MDEGNARVAVVLSDEEGAGGARVAECLEGMVAHGLRVLGVGEALKMSPPRKWRTAVELERETHVARSIASQCGNVRVRCSLAKMSAPRLVHFKFMPR